MTTKPLVFGDDDPKPTKFDLHQTATDSVKTPWQSLIAQFFPAARSGERAANAALFIDAVSTYNETGLTPSQLVEQRGELLTALRLVLPMARGYAAEHRVGNNTTFCEQASAAIAKAEGG